MVKEGIEPQGWRETTMGWKAPLLGKTGLRMPQEVIFAPNLYSFNLCQ